MYIHYRSFKLMTLNVRIITRISWMWTEIYTSQHKQKSETKDAVVICEIAISIHLFGRINL